MRYDDLFVGRSLTPDEFGDDSSFHCLVHFLPVTGKFSNSATICKNRFNERITAYLSCYSSGVSCGKEKGFKFVGVTGKYVGLLGTVASSDTVYHLQSKECPMREINFAVLANS